MLTIVFAVRCKLHFDSCSHFQHLLVGAYCLVAKMRFQSRILGLLLSIMWAARGTEDLLETVCFKNIVESRWWWTSMIARMEWVSDWRGSMCNAISLRTL